MIYTTSLQARGPFRIVGTLKTRRSPWRVISFALLPSVWRSSEIWMNRYGSASWWRKPSLKDRGPFSLFGKWHYKWSGGMVYTFVLTGTFAYFEDSLNWDLYKTLTQIGRAPWINYSCNISTRRTCL
jgi:hypothetical protein